MLQRAENSEFNHFSHLFDGIFSLLLSSFFLLFLKPLVLFEFSAGFHCAVAIFLFDFFPFFLFILVLLSTKRIEKVHTSRWYLNLQILNTRHQSICALAKRHALCKQYQSKKKRWNIFENEHIRLKSCTIVVFLCKYSCHILLHARLDLYAEWTECYTQRGESKKKKENTCKSHQYFTSDSLGCCCSEASFHWLFFF